MGEGSGQVGQGLGDQRGSDQVREEIEETRQELGDTVSSLAQKADVKGQAKDKAAEIRNRVQDKVAGARQTASAKSEELTGKAKEASPDSATEGAQRAADMARENPLPVAAGASFVAGVIFGRLVGRRKYRKLARGKA
jgi:ElaB/YqjD/DUF883 family membrane-anchored ribosome-binding protein